MGSQSISSLTYPIINPASLAANPDRARVAKRVNCLLGKIPHLPRLSTLDSPCQAAVVSLAVMLFYFKKSKRHKYLQNFAEVFRNS
jgi:hypothetical protein